MSAAWPPPETERARLREGVGPHPFNSGNAGYAHFACTLMVERDGSGEDCGLPADDLIHDDPYEGQDFDYGRPW